MWGGWSLTTRVLVGGGWGRHGERGLVSGFPSRYSKLEHLDRGEVDLKKTSGLCCDFS